MVEIELKYNQKSESISIPQSWNELNLDQLLYVAKFWESWKLMAKANVTLLRAKALLFVQLMNGNTRFNLKSRIDRISKLTNEELFELTELTSFIFKANTLTVCPFPVLRFGFKKFYPPNDNLGNIKAEEFHFADMFYLQYVNHDHDKALDYMIATLYRPKLNGSRIPFNYEKIEPYSKTLRLSYEEKQAILLWYIGCREKMVENNKDLFSAPNEASARNNGWLPIIMALSGDKFGSFNETKQMDMALIFMEIRESKERKPKQ